MSLEPNDTNEEDNVEVLFHDIDEGDNVTKAAHEAHLASRASREIDRYCAAYFRYMATPITYLKINPPRPNILLRFIYWLRKLRRIADKPIQNKPLEELYEECGDTPEWWEKRKALILQDHNEEINHLLERHRQERDECEAKLKQGVHDQRGDTARQLSELAEDKAKEDHRSNSQPPQTS